MPEKHRIVGWQLQHGGADLESSGAIGSLAKGALPNPLGTVWEQLTPKATQSHTLALALTPNHIPGKA
jgi:hypothetical protein